MRTQRPARTPATHPLAKEPAAMRRSMLLLLALTMATLAGCGNKGPLQLPATRPAASPPAAAPATATSTPARPGSVQY
jgi:predicted small lipoprotein YifL